MPHALVKFSRDFPYENNVKLWCISHLAQLVAQHLGVDGSKEDAALAPKDVEVSFETAGPHDQLGRYHVGITIEANDYSVRRPLTDAASKAIRDSVIQEFPQLKRRVFVWVRLSWGSFAD